MKKMKRGKETEKEGGRKRESEGERVMVGKRARGKGSLRDRNKLIVLLF